MIMAHFIRLSENEVLKREMSILSKEKKLLEREKQLVKRENVGKIDTPNSLEISTKNLAEMIPNFNGTVGRCIIYCFGER